MMIKNWQTRLRKQTQLYADKVDNNAQQTSILRLWNVAIRLFTGRGWIQIKFTEAHNIQPVGVTDDHEEDKLDINVANIKAYDSVTGEDVTAKFDIKVENGADSSQL